MEGMRVRRKGDWKAVRRRREWRMVVIVIDERKGRRIDYMMEGRRRE